MARCPFAVWKPLPENATADKIDPRVVILHTAVSRALSLYPFFGTIGETLESTFYTRMDGVIEQYMDTERQADANRDANDFAISVENQDNAALPIIAMPRAQLESNIKLFRWCSDVHPKIKRQRCDRWDGSGYGYHTMWGAPSHWTPSKGKTCPAPARIKQFEEIMIPALITPSTPVNHEEEDDMKTMIVRAPDGAVYVFDGMVLRPCNNEIYRGILRFFGSAVPETGDPWFNFTKEQIDAIPKVPGN